MMYYASKQCKCTVCDDYKTCLCIDKNLTFLITLAYIYVRQRPYSTIAHTLIIQTTVTNDKRCMYGKLISVQ